MDDKQWLPERFEESRPHLRAVAYRMLGSLPEAEDAVQEAWLRLSRTDARGIENLKGWLTTVVANVCLDMLRSRKSRGEESLDTVVAAEPVATSGAGADPEREAVLADSVGLALLVVLDTLAPAERLAFVLHDMFAVPFDEIASIVGRSPDAARQLASRARRRVQGAETADVDRAGQRQVVEAFLAALRGGDFDGLLAVLDPDVVVRTDIAGAAVPEVRGAATWARGAITAARGAQFARVALVNGEVGLVVAPRGRLFRALSFKFAGGKIAEVEVIGNPERLRQLEFAVVPESDTAM